MMRSSGAVLAVTPSPQLTCSFAFLCPPFPISFLGESADVLLDHVSRAFRNTLESPAQSVAKFCVAASESRRSQPASPPPAGGSWAPSPASPGGFGWHLHAACDETEMQTVGAMSSKPHGRQAAAPGWHRARHLAERSRDSPAVTVRPFPRQDGPARSLKAGVAFQCPSSLGTVPAGRRRGQQAQDAVVSRASPDHRRGRAVYVPLSPQNAASRDEPPRTPLPPARRLSPPRGSGLPKRHMKILNRGVSR